ncbi:hypothetical protein Nepgr_001631 [Nepenthes gracilis]|uniref:Pentatricopeptide repeat-containing protein n=1 Tax=Nepenthes gracilis TaxID=150966 RepID=A0AAD3RW74_NEPGR|nr:hypothetical protein Nepgr_001631 [Nepenthes gracilis]
MISAPRLRPIPQTVMNSLKSAVNCTTQISPPFSYKSPVVLATKVIKSYFEKGLTREARTLFEEMPERDVVAWTALISGYTSCSCHFDAWMAFFDMLRAGVKPNEFTMSSALKACKGMKYCTLGALVHGFAIKHGLVGFIYVDNALIDIYASRSVGMDEACMVFRDIYSKNSVSWTTLITGYTHHGDGYGALRVFQQMFSDEAELSPFTFSIAIRACASIGFSALGRQIHAMIIKYGLESNIPVMNSILDMYCRRNSLSEATQCFHEMTRKDLITWNSLIAGYERSDSRECLHVFSLMESEGFTPDCFTFTSVAAACANLALLNCGQQVHAAIVQRGINGNMALANALIDMYAKCGSVIDSRKIFSEMSCRNLLSWTSMMIGYGTHGYGKEAVELFDEMVKSHIRPDRIVFMAVLSACSHAGLVDEGLKYFELVGEYNITPDQEIYGCVVDLLGRSGRVAEAYELIRSMPFSPDEYVLGAFLGACKAYKLPNLGNLAAQRMLNLRPNMAGTYVMLSNLYAADGMWGEFAKMRKLMKGLGSKKEAGRSWIELKNEVYSFVVREKVGSHMEWIYKVLNVMVQHMKEAGYFPELDYLIHDLENGT